MRNVSHGCPKCSRGWLYPDAGESVCVNCGHRVSARRLRLNDPVGAKTPDGWHILRSDSRYKRELTSPNYDLR